MTQSNRKGAVLYIRTAKSEQGDNKAQLEQQEALCRAYCASKGWSIEEVFADSATSGHSLSRPALNKMLSYCSRNRAIVRYVVAEDSSRIASDPRLALHVIMTLNRSHVSLRSINDDRDVDLWTIAECDGEEVPS